MLDADTERKLVAHLGKAGELLKQEKLPDAEREVQAALALAPDDERGKNLLGLLLFRAGRYDQARGVYNDLVARAPEDTALRLNLGLVELRMGKHAEAAEHLGKVVGAEPKNVKAQGYFGLALMRAGDLPRAREAFLAANQPDLARQVEERMGRPGKTAAATGSVDGVVLEGEPPIKMDAPIEPTGPAAKVLLPEKLPGFLERRALRRHAGEPFVIVDGTLVVSIEQRIFTRTAGALASSGRVAYQPVTRRVRGRPSDEPFGEGDEGMVLASGNGLISVSPRGGQFTALALAGEVLYVRESSVFSFEEELYWESGRIPGGVGEGFRVVQLRGDGRLVLRSRRSPSTLSLTGSEVFYVDQAALLGWTGQVLPTHLRGNDGAPTQYIACSGEGAILVEDPTDTGVVVMEPDEAQ